MIEKDQWPPNSPDLNPLVWRAMLEKYHKLQPKPKTIAELKDALQSICVLAFFNHAKTVGLSRLKSHIFVIFQDN